MKRIITLFVLLICNFIFSQLPDGLPKAKDSIRLSNEDFEWAKAEYLKMFNSEDSQKTREMQKNIRIKLEYNILPVINSDDQLITWLRENLNTTKFSSIDEGLEILCPFYYLCKKIDNDHAVLRDLLTRSSIEQCKEIIKPEIDNIKETWKG